MEIQQKKATTLQNMKIKQLISMGINYIKSHSK